MRRVIKGFTLVELILVILVLGIVSTSVTSFITFGVGIYQDVSGRDKQLSDSRFVIERMTREIREALPNSVRVTSDGTCIEFIPILASSSYVDIPVSPDTASSSVDIVVSDESFTQANTKLVVYPLDTDEVYVDGSDTTGKFFTISSYGSGVSNVMTLTLTNNVLFDEHSPTERYFIVNASVAYCQASDNSIYRYQGHNLTEIQSTNTGFAANSGVLMAENQTNAAPFSKVSPTLTRNSIVVFDFTFAFDDESLRQVNEVHIANVP